jgi:PEGA domain
VLIMKALAKNPAERYQSARELVDDLEKCKENGKKAPTDSKKTTQAPNVAVNSAARAAAASKFVSAASSAAKLEAPVRSQTAPPAAGKAAAAAAGAVTGGSAGRASNANSGARLIDEVAGEFEVSAPESQAAPGPVLSAAVVEQEVQQEVEQESEHHSPRVAVDPMMAEPVASSSRTSFSDLAEMPPLKEPVFAPPPVPEPSEPSRPVAQIYPRKDEKPKVQPREVAQKAIKEIATVPPRLMLYSILGAVGLILVVAIAIFFHVRSEDDGSTAAPRPTKAVKPVSPSTQPVAQTPVAPPIENPAPPIADPQPSLTVRQVEKRSSIGSRRMHAPAPVTVIPGQALIDSSPQGAQFQVDGRSDPSWVTPLNVTGLGPGKHIISASKSGYSSEIRSVEVAAGSKTSLVLHLSPVNALMVVNSTPPGATVILDGKPSGRVTPAQFAVEKGSHTVLLRKPGYLDETVTADLGPAQNFQYSPVLRALGNADEMRTVGKFNKLFGQHGGDSAAGMGTISIHTQPKGAQVAINQRVLDKLSPVDVMLGPGNYIVDVTLTGFKPVHKVISVDRGSKAAIDEILERQ